MDELKIHQDWLILDYWESHKQLLKERDEARYWARRMMKERDDWKQAAERYESVAHRYYAERDALQAKLDAVIMKIESVCRGEYSGEDPYYILRNYLKSIKE